MGDFSPDKVAAYWDANNQKSKDPTFWMAHPLCRRAINRRISGSPHEWSLDWFKRCYAQTPFKRGISWGAGLGAFERNIIRACIAQEVDAFDISPVSLDEARREAAKEGVRGIHYQIGNFNDPDVRPGLYEICFFHASLHHIFALERMFRRLAVGLKGRAVIYVDEFVGPSRGHWTAQDLALPQAILDMVPDTAKVASKIAAPIEVNDPSESIRSGELEKFLRDFFDVIEWRPYGGQIVDVVLPCIRHDWANSPEGHRYIQAMLDVEEAELVRDASTTHHVVFVGRLKRIYRLAWPLGSQVWKAVKRRLDLRAR